MKREQLETISSRVLPAMLVGVIATMFAWGAGALWVVAFQRSVWLYAGLCWAGVFAVPRAWQDARGAFVAHTISSALFGGLLTISKIAWPKSLPSVWLFGIVAGSILLVRWLIARRRDTSAWSEATRLLLLIFAAWWACRPLFTANLLGGLDARWYAYTLFDFLEQLRAGVFPVLVGQGPYQFNGAVHPFRFAPYFQYFAGALDVVTGHSLGGFALQHLTAIASSFLGAATMYLSLISLAPRLRWVAALTAAVYALCPAWVGLVNFLDMYMSYMAVAWLPIVLCGVARSLERPDPLAYVLVAAGLSITWMCHAPVAVWASLVVIGVFGAAWISQGAPWRGAVRLLAMLLLFAVLSAYHLYSVIEVTPLAANALRPGFTTVWLLLAGAGFVFWFVAKKLLPVSASAENASERGSLWLLVAGVGVLVIAAISGGWLLAPKDVVIADTVGYTKLYWPAVLWPVHVPNPLFSDIQPGYAVWLLGAVGLVAAVRVPEARAKIFGLALLVLTCFQIPFSHATEALWSLLPTSLLVATSGAVNLRLSPVWVTLMAFAGFCAMTWVAAERPRAYRFLVWALVALLPWSAWEANKLTKRLAVLEFSAAESENFRRAENATLFIYSGNQIGSPGYFSNGMRDYRLESRVLDPQTFAVRPDLSTAAPVPAGKEVVFTIKPAGGVWELEPHLMLLRDEPWLTVWKFSGPVPEGTLTMSATDIFKEYQLPSSGGPKSFGSGPTNSRELPLWTTSPFVEDLTLRIQPAVAPDPKAAPREFARVELRPLSNDWLPVTTLSLVPAYRASVIARAPALLETCRTWAPGYRATRNGYPVSLVRTPEGLVGVPLVTGTNEIVLRFAGTTWLWRMFVVSFLGWVGLSVWLVMTASGKDFSQHFRRKGV